MSMTDIPMSSPSTRYTAAESATNVDPPLPTDAGDKRHNG